MRHLLVLCAMAVPGMVTAQVTASRTSSGCVLANDQASRISARGVLRHATFKDPQGRPERYYVLHLLRPTCVEDGGTGMIDGKEPVSDIQISGPPSLEMRLARLVGKRVRVSGNAMPRSTGHHHTPLLIVAPISVTAA